MTIPLQSAALYDGQEVFVWSVCPLDLGMDFPVGNNGLCMRCIVSCGDRYWITWIPGDRYWIIWIPGDRYWTAFECLLFMSLEAGIK